MDAVDCRAREICKCVCRVEEVLQTAGSVVLQNQLELISSSAKKPVIVLFSTISLSLVCTEMQNDAFPEKIDRFRERVLVLGVIWPLRLMK